MPSLIEHLIDGLIQLKGAEQDAVGCRVEAARIGVSGAEGGAVAPGPVAGLAAQGLGIGVADELMAGGRAGDTPVAGVHWGTTRDQRVVRSTLAELASVDLPAPAAIVIGPVAGLDLTDRPDEPS